MAFRFLQNVQERATEMCRFSVFDRQPVSVAIQERETGEIRPYTPDRNREHELQLVITTRFWANKAQYPDARNMAERYLVELVTGESLALLGRIEKAIFDGDAKAAFGWLGELRRALEHRS